MPQLEFIDCPHCAKRVASTAKLCRHCGLSPRDASIREADSDAESQHAVAFGGYDHTTDDFDYDEFVAEEFPEEGQLRPGKNLWWYVSILMLVVFGLLSLWPML